MRGTQLADGTKAIVAKIDVPLHAMDIAMYALMNDKLRNEASPVTAVDGMTKRAVYAIAKEAIYAEGITTPTWDSVVADNPNRNPQEVLNFLQYIRGLFPEVD